MGMAVHAYGNWTEIFSKLTNRIIILLNHIVLLVKWIQYVKLCSPCIAKSRKEAVPWNKDN